MPAVPFDAIASNLIVAAGLALIAVALGRWVNRPAVAHVLWLLVLVKLVTPPLFAVPIRVLPPEEPVAVAVEPTPAAPVTAKAGAIPEIVIQNQIGQSPAFPEAAASPIPAPRPSRPFPWRSVLLGVWAFGAIVWVAVTVLHVRRFAKYLRFATPAPNAFVREVAAVADRLGLSAPQVKMLPGEVAPFVWSVGTTTLYFPVNLLDRLTADQRATVVAHELAHVWRRDHLVRWLEMAAVAVYWWCPLAWVARRELRRLEEDCCDSIVMTAYPKSGPTYASAILDTIDFLATARAMPRFASGMGDVKSLRKRLTRILNGASASNLSRTTRLSLIAFAVVLLAAGPRLARLTAMVAPVAEPPPTAKRDEPRLLDQPREAVQFLPTPIRLKLADSMETVTAAAMSPDGRFLALATGSEVMVWDLDAKHVAFGLTGHAAAVNAVAYAPDGRSIATASNDATVKVWNLTSGTHRTLAGHTNWVLAVAFSPDGRRLASAGYDKQIRVHDLANADAVTTLVGHTAVVRAIHFSPDGKRLASVGADPAVKVWDVARAAEERTLTGHAATVRAVAFSPDGLQLATGGEDRTVRIWNLVDGSSAGVVRSPDAVTTLTFSAGGGVLFAGTFGGHVLNINPATGRPRGHVGPQQPTHADAIAAVLPSPTGHLLFTLSHDGMVLVWPSAGLPETSLRLFRGHAQDMTAVAVSADGKFIATGSADGGIRIWTAATTAEVGRLDGHTGGVTALAFLDDTRLLSTGHDERVRVWSVTRGQQIRTMIVPTADLKVAISPNGKTLAVTGARMAGVMLWDIESGTLLRRIATKLDRLTAVAFTPDGQKIAVGNAIGDVIVCQLPTGKEEQRLSMADSGRVDQIVFSRNGGQAAVVVNQEADEDAVARHEVVFWDVWARTTHANFQTLKNTGPVHAIAFDRTETRVLTAGHDGHLYEWDPATGRRTRMLHAHREAVVSLVLPGDGKTVLSAGDQSAKLWEWPLETKP